MFLVVEDEESRSSGVSPPLLFIFKGHGLKHMTYINSRQTRSKEQSEKNMKKASVCLSKTLTRRGKRNRCAKRFALRANTISNYEVDLSKFNFSCKFVAS